MERSNLSDGGTAEIKDVRSSIIETLASVIESLLFAYGEPLAKQEIKEVFTQMDMSISESQFQEAVALLRMRYEQSISGLEMLVVGDKYQLGTKKENYECLSILLRPIKKKSLTQASLETLSIIAYKQPITKSQIESIRGVKCDRALHTLMEAGLIQENGRLEKIGRPIIYGTSEEFLRHFSLSSLDELPSIEEWGKDISSFDSEDQQQDWNDRS